MQLAIGAVAEPLWRGMAARRNLLQLALAQMDEPGPTCGIGGPYRHISKRWKAHYLSLKENRRISSRVQLSTVIPTSRLHVLWQIEGQLHGKRQRFFQRFVFEKLAIEGGVGRKIVFWIITTEDQKIEIVQLPSADRTSDVRWNRRIYCGPLEAMNLAIGVLVRQAAVIATGRQLRNTHAPRARSGCSRNHEQAASDPSVHAVNLAAGLEVRNGWKADIDRGLSEPKPVPMLVRMGFLFVTVAAAASCSQSPSYCGEAFCLFDKPQAVSKKALIDFNIYQIDYRGEHFAVYEGDNPDLLRPHDLGPVPPDVVPPGFVEGRLYRGDDGYSLALRTTNPPDAHKDSRWSPTYVVAYETKHDPMALQRFASILRAKRNR